VDLHLNVPDCKAACEKRCDCLSIQARSGHCLLKNYICTDAELSSKGSKGYAEYSSK
jgi:hypothetical protein